MNDQGRATRAEQERADVNRRRILNLENILKPAGYRMEEATEQVRLMQELARLDVSDFRNPDANSGDDRFPRRRARARRRPGLPRRAYQWKGTRTIGQQAGAFDQ